ncbi:hypothetical protein ACDT12_13105 [Staphylococcus aureus]
MTPRRHLLANANDWVIAADINDFRNYPQAIRDSGKRPDVVISSARANSFILVELTVPFEDRMEERNISKREKYDELTADLRDTGYEVSLFAVEVGARGLPGRSLYAFLRKLGLSSRERAGFMRGAAGAAESASAWIWRRRDKINHAGFVGDFIFFF